jgi:hypothetical protein
MSALTDASRATADRLTRIDLPLREAEALAPAEQPNSLPWLRRLTEIMPSARSTS